MKSIVGMMALTALAGCQQRAVQNVSVANDAAPMNTVRAAPERNEATNVAQPDRTPLIEPKGRIDPKSSRAAGQVVQHYGALIEQRRWKDAEALFGDPATAAEATTALRSRREVHLEIGDPGKPEGAAGSIYISIPITFYGKKADGSAFREPASAFLRRTNDVPGATQAQRRWHLDRIIWRRNDLVSTRA